MNRYDEDASTIGREADTFVDILRWRAEHQGEQTAHIFLNDGDEQETHLTYAELDRQARSIAAHLLRAASPGDRVLLVYPPGLDFVAGFLGCLYAGAIAVPAYPPHPKRPDRRLFLLALDAQPAAALTNAFVLAGVEAALGQAPAVGGLKWLATDRLEEDLSGEWVQPEVGRDDLAYLQYTSGSTAAPRGVMLTHGNMLHQSEVIREVSRLSGDSVSVSWLPGFHDMGLIDGVLQPIYTGFPGVRLSPVAFLRRPIRWLRAISRYGGTHGGGPNVGFNLCIGKTTPAEREGLDLSSWTTAYNGAEPVRVETLRFFAKTFEPCGFRAEFMRPVYGLAEGTLMVTGGPKLHTARVLLVNAAALETGRIVSGEPAETAARPIVGCGEPVRDTHVAIVDPDTGEECPPDQVGEIWVAGPSVAQGYWQKREETQETFGARLEGRAEGPFLRTGDLGFLQDGQLFVTGRIKDLIIIRGRNHYPHDIELTVEHCHPAARPHCGAAFAVDLAGEERLVVLQELNKEYVDDPPVEDVMEAMRAAISEEHDLELHAAVLTPPNALVKTSSGKIARHACRERYLAGDLPVLGSWEGPIEDALGEEADLDAATAAPAPEAEADEGGDRTRRSAVEIQDWLVGQIAAKQYLDVATIDPKRPFTDYGLDSLATLDLTEKLQEWLGRPIEDTALFDHPTAESLARFLAEE